MLYALSIIMGFFLGCGATLHFKKTSQKNKYLRRGIYDHTFEATGFAGNKTKVGVQFEVGELERTENKSKIEVIRVTPDTTEYSTEHYKKKMTDLINHSWIVSTSFDWIEDDVTEKRNQKIDQLLS
jgi:hypothetical protein